MRRARLLELLFLRRRTLRIVDTRVAHEHEEVEVHLTQPLHHAVRDAVRLLDVLHVRSAVDQLRTLLDERSVPVVDVVAAQAGDELG